MRLKESKKLLSFSMTKAAVEKDATNWPPPSSRGPALSHDSHDSNPRKSSGQFGPWVVMRFIREGGEVFNHMRARAPRFFFIHLLFSMQLASGLLGLETQRRPSAWASTPGAGPRTALRTFPLIRGKMLDLWQRRRECYVLENIVSLCQTKQNSAISFYDQ